MQMTKSERDKLREWAMRHADDGTSPNCIAGHYAKDLLDYVDRLEDALKEVRVYALLTEPEKCEACEPGNAWEPEFICGYHELLNQIDQALEGGGE